MAMEWISKHSVEWASLNQYLTGNQAGVESDTGKFKFGVGYWNSLSYATLSSDALVINTLPTGSAVASLAAASTVVTRDSSANISADAFISSVTSTVTASATTTLTSDSTQIQIFTGTNSQTILLPTTGVVVGRAFVIINQSTSTIQVQSSGGNAIVFVAGNTGGSVVVQANTATPTTAAHWNILSYSATTGYTSGVVAAALRDTNNILSARAFIPGSASTVTAAGTTTLTVGSGSIQIFTGSTTQTVTLPTTSIILGWRATIINKSSGALTINSSGGGLVATVTGGATAQIMANTTTPTTAAHWSVLTNGGTA